MRTVFSPIRTPSPEPLRTGRTDLKAARQSGPGRSKCSIHSPSRGALPAVAQALATVTSQDAQGWFRQCGYAMH